MTSNPVLTVPWDVKYENANEALTKLDHFVELSIIHKSSTYKDLKQISDIAGNDFKVSMEKLVGDNNSGYTDLKKTYVLVALAIKMAKIREKLKSYQPFSATQESGEEDEQEGTVESSQILQNTEKEAAGNSDDKLAESKIMD